MMPLAEEELRQHLQQAASQVQGPRFTHDQVSGRVRRRRARIMTVVLAGLAAVVALAVAIPAELAGGARPGSVSAPVIIRPLPASASVNGRSPSRSLTVTSGEHLTIAVGVTIPARYRVTHLWLGISGGTFEASRTAPIGMRPILKQTRGVLLPGHYRFYVKWTVPAELRQPTVLWLALDWAGVAPEVFEGSHKFRTEAEVTSRAHIPS
jgi:hypothetical protein